MKFNKGQKDSHPPQEDAFDFEEAQRWLSSFQFHGIKPGLFRIYRLLKKLGHPERKFQAVHIAGTNGKGSTAAFLEHLLRFHGLKTGLYTSPHLVSVRERFLVNGRPVSEEDFARLCGRLKEALGGLSATYFELTTALAFALFAEEGVEVAVVECGLGGRLDATNVLWPALSVITTIGLDHQAYLGETLPQIAWEKAGVIKRGRPLVLGKVPPEARRVIEARARVLNAPTYALGRDFSVVKEGEGFTYRGERELRGLEPGLKGPFQAENLALALKAAELLAAELGLRLEEEKIREAVSRARWPGRFEEFSGPKRVILDGAHNLDGIRALIEALEEEGIGPVNLIFAASDEDHRKPYLKMLEALLPRARRVFICEPKGPRRPVKLEEWRRELSALGLEGPFFFCRNPEEALREALKGKEPILVTGSLYLVGNVRELLALDKNQSPG